MTQEARVLARSLHRHFGHYHAVNDVTIHLNKGEVLGLLGPNGAGKSTTMKMLTGNLSPDTGEILINGADLLDNPRKAKRQIGYLPEQPPLYRDMNVREYLGYCARLHGIPKAKVRTAIDSALERCGLTAVHKRLIANLSKGYQQRTGIAQAILHDPAVVILDEPTVGLDPIQIQEIRHLIRELGNNHSVILSTHILPEVQAVCDRVQIIHRGQTVFEDTLDGLEHRHGNPVLLVSYEHEVDAGKLAALPGVNAVDESGFGKYRLQLDHLDKMATKVCKLSFAQDWKLTALTPQAVNLESIFLDLVHKEES